MAPPSDSKYVCQGARDLAGAAAGYGPILDVGGERKHDPYRGGHRFFEGKNAVRGASCK
jgi:hypothetical protein